jgi:hypothetical protein
MFKLALLLLFLTLHLLSNFLHSPGPWKLPGASTDQEGLGIARTFEVSDTAKLVVVCVCLAWLVLLFVVVVVVLFVLLHGFVVCCCCLLLLLMCVVGFDVVLYAFYV